MHGVHHRRDLPVQETVGLAGVEGAPLRLAAEMNPSEISDNPRWRTGGERNGNFRHGGRTKHAISASRCVNALARSIRNMHRDTFFYDAVTSGLTNRLRFTVTSASHASLQTMTRRSGVVGIQESEFYSHRR